MKGSSVIHLERGCKTGIQLRLHYLAWDRLKYTEFNNREMKNLRFFEPNNWFTHVVELSLKMIIDNLICFSIIIYVTKHC